MPNPPGLSPKDGLQVLRAVMDDENNRLRVDAVISPDGHDLEINYQDDSIAIGDPASDNILKINNDGSINVDLVMPTSLSVTQGTTPWVVSGTVAATQSGTWTTDRTWNTSSTTDSITVIQGAGTRDPSVWEVEGTVTANAGTGTFLTDGSAHTQPISAASLPLPTGASTETTLSAFESANHTDLTTINTTLGSPMQNSGGSVTANQGTSPWVVSGSVTTSPNVNIHDGIGTSISSTGSSLNVDVTNTIPVAQSGSWTVTSNAGSGTFLVDGSAHTQPVSGTITANAGTGTFLVDGSAHTQPVSGTVTATQGTSPWVTSVSNFPATVAVTQSTSPWVVSGSVTTSPNVNVHDGSGNSISSTSGSLNVDVTNTIPVSQSGTWNIGTVTTITNPVAVTQSTSPWVVSGTVSTSNFPTTVDINYGVVGANTIRTAAEIGNATGAANFNSGATGAQTLRTVTNLNDGSANSITSTTINTKQRLDINLASDGVAASSVPFQVGQVGGKDTSGNLQPLSIDENGILIETNSLTSFNAQSKVFSAQTPAITAGTTETPFLLLRNPNASGKTVKIYKMNFIGTGLFRMYSLPTITVNGTTVAPQLRKITSGAQGNVGLATTLPTATSNGTLLQTYSNTAQAIGILEFPSYIILPANTSLLITTAMGANNTLTYALIEWAEL